MITKFKIFENVYNYHEIVKKGDIFKFIKLLDNGFDPSTERNFSICMASYYGHIKLVKLLLNDERVDPSAVNNYPIRYAADNNHIEIVKLLLNDGRVDPSDGNNSAIDYAYRKNNKEIVKLLLDDNRVLNKLSKKKINTYKSII